MTQIHRTSDMRCTVKLTTLPAAVFAKTINSTQNLGRIGNPCYSRGLQTGSKSERKNSARPPKIMHFGEFPRDAENRPSLEVLAGKQLTAINRANHPQVNSPPHRGVPEMVNRPNCNGGNELCALSRPGW